MRLAEAHQLAITDEDIDFHLGVLCRLIDKGQEVNPNHYGMVAACILDPSGNYRASTSTAKDGKMVHAERNAIDSYVKKFGDVPTGSIVITTLSPCSKHISDRFGSSCTDILEQNGIKDVYCGYLDPTQDSGSNTFTIHPVSNQEIIQRCKQYADTFLDKPENITEGTDFKKLQKNKKPLTPEERKLCMDREAVWHMSHLKGPSPAVWKSVDPKTGKTTFVTNTHRAYNTAPTLKGAIGRFHKFIKSTA